MNDEGLRFTPTGRLRKGQDLVMVNSIEEAVANQERRSEPRGEGLREAALRELAEAYVPGRDASLNRMQLDNLRREVIAYLDAATPPAPALPREPGTYRTADGGIEVIVDVEESASWVEDQFPDEVEYILAHRPAPALDVERVRRVFHDEYERERNYGHSQRGCKHGDVWDCRERRDEWLEEYAALAPERQEPPVIHASNEQEP